jgi:hypothetical protein
VPRIAYVSAKRKKRERVERGRGVEGGGGRERRNCLRKARNRLP